MVLELLLIILVMLLMVLDLSWSGVVLATGNINDIHRGTFGRRAKMTCKTVACSLKPSYFWACVCVCVCAPKMCPKKMATRCLKLVPVAPECAETSLSNFQV